jgi:hypothetical protein
MNYGRTNKQKNGTETWKKGEGYKVETGKRKVRTGLMGNDMK